MEKDGYVEGYQWLSGTILLDKEKDKWLDISGAIKGYLWISEDRKWDMLGNEKISFKISLWINVGYQYTRDILSF